MAWPLMAVANNESQWLRVKGKKLSSFIATHPNITEYYILKFYVHITLDILMINLDLHAKLFVKSVFMLLQVWNQIQRVHLKNISILS